MLAFQVADAGEVDADADFEEAEADEGRGGGLDERRNQERAARGQEGDGEQAGVGN